MSRSYLTVENALKGSVPAQGELVWSYVNLADFRVREFELVQINPSQWVMKPAPLGQESLLAIFAAHAEPWQRQLVADYRRQAKTLANESIVLIDSWLHKAVDGQHRLMAMGLEGITRAQALDLSKPRT